MKGYVKVTTKQIQEAVDGFTLIYNEGCNLRKIGIDRYYRMFYLESKSWYTRRRYKNYKPIEFVRSRLTSSGRMSWLLEKVMTEDEIDKVNFWETHSLFALDGPKAMISESSDGFAFVDSEMAKAINDYRSYVN